MAFVAVLAFVWGIYSSPSYPLGKNLHDARLQIERELSAGTSRIDLLKYVDDNFEESRFDSKHRCLITRYTIYTSGKFRTVDSSMLSFFYFDSADKLIQIKHRTDFQKMSLESPEEIAERWENNPTIVEARRILQETDHGYEKLNKELMETATALRQLARIAPSTQTTDDMREAADKVRATTTPSGETVR